MNHRNCRRVKHLQGSKTKSSCLNWSLHGYLTLPVIQTVIVKLFLSSLEIIVSDIHRIFFALCTAIFLQLLTAVALLSCMKSSNYQALSKGIIINHWIKQLSYPKLFLKSVHLSDPMIAGAYSPSICAGLCVCLCAFVCSPLGSQDRFRSACRCSPARPPAAGDRSALWHPQPNPPPHQLAPTFRILSRRCLYQPDQQGAACFFISLVWHKCPSI